MTDHSSTMADLAPTGMPILLHFDGAEIPPVELVPGLAG